MAWSNLPTDYQDAAWEGSRKFNMTRNNDGSYSFEDITEYTQIAKAYRSAVDVNATNEAINNIMEVFESGYKLSEPTNVDVTNLGNGVLISWTDPSNVVDAHGMTMVQWNGTKVVRKQGSAPESETDGIVVVDEKVRNTYSSNGFIDSSVANGETYYYGIFPYSSEGRYTTSMIVPITPAASTLTTPTINSISYSSPDVTINFTNSNADAYTKIVYKTNSAPTSPTDGTVINEVTGSSYTIQNVAEGHIYYFVIYAYDNAGISNPSNAQPLMLINGETINVTIESDDDLYELTMTDTVTVTVTDTTDASYTQVASRVGEGSLTFRIPTDHYYYVTTSIIDGYNTPSGTTPKKAVLNTSTNLTFSYTSIITDFSKISWAKLSYLCEDGQAAELYSNGDVKTIKIGDNDVDLVILGIEQYDKSDDSGKAGLLLGIRYPWFSTDINYRRWNTTDSNSGGWAASTLRAKLNNEFFYTLPSDLQQVIKQVNVPYNIGGQSSTINNSIDRIFIPSYRELYSANLAEAYAEGTYNSFLADYIYQSNSSSDITSNTCFAYEGLSIMSDHFFGYLDGEKRLLSGGRLYMLTRSPYLDNSQKYIAAKDRIKYSNEIAYLEAATNNISATEPKASAGGDKGPRVSISYCADILPMFCI